MELIRDFPMFKTNIGGTDRILRIVVGIAMLVGFFALPDASYRWFLLIGIVPLATGLMRTCPAYSILGITTCPTKKV
jgi:hypothetical protein